ncbi:MAG: hypothetical protein NTX44_05075 [Ignavibacteriales bacterium]|nr:hypothetical protein [Ignavibacteriales bacterium]
MIRKIIIVLAIFVAISTSGGFAQSSNADSILRPQGQFNAIGGLRTDAFHGGIMYSLTKFVSVELNLEILGYFMYPSVGGSLSFYLFPNSTITPIARIQYLFDYSLDLFFVSRELAEEINLNIGFDAVLSSKFRLFFCGGYCTKTIFKDSDRPYLKIFIDVGCLYTLN